jgi:putative aminopeptidase FrvX
MGNVIAEYKGTDEKSPVVMAFAHLDQLGFIVRKIEKDGFIQLERLGGIPEKVLPGLNICIQSTDGNLIPGVIGTKSHHASSAEEKYKVDLITSLFVDIGANSSDEVRNLGIEIGCPATYMPSFQHLNNNYISGTSVDNRGGLTALAIAGQLLRKKRPNSTVYLVGTVWEEFNLRGAMLAARSIKPDITISLDVALTGDTRDLNNRYEVVCGKGPVLILYSFHGRGTLNGTLPHEGLVKLTKKIAQKKNIPLQYFASQGILTDSSYVQLEGKGTAAIELGFPTRYTHTPVEVADTDDICMLGELLAGIVDNIDVNFDLSRY